MESKKMRTMKKVAWLLSFVMIVFLVFENVGLTAFATGDAASNQNASTPTFTISISDYTGLSNGNQVRYKFNDENNWTTASSGNNPITIGTNTSITVKVEKVIPKNLPDFYITNVTFYKTGYQGVKVEQQGPVPDIFDGLVMSDTVDISNTTQSDS